MKECWWLFVTQFDRNKLNHNIQVQAVTVLSEAIDRIIFFGGERGSHQKNTKVNTESKNQLWHHQCLNLDNCQVLGPRLPPWIRDGRQEDPWNVWPQRFGNQLSPRTQRSSPCVSRQEISERNQMANELMFILSREKKLGIGQVPLQQSQGTAQLTPTAPKLLLGLPPEGGFHFPALDLLTWDTVGSHRYRADYLPRKIQPKAIFGQREYRFFIVSQRWQQLIAVKAKHHHSNSGTIQDVLKDRTEV